MKKEKIIYVFDAICSWCYGFEPTVLELMKKYEDEYDFQIVSGGLSIGPEKKRIKDRFGGSDPRPIYARVATTSGADISPAYIDGLVMRDNFQVNSETTAHALSAYRALTPESTALEQLEFVYTIQKQIYRDGKNPNEDTFYSEAAGKVGKDGTLLVEKMKNEEIQKNSFADFSFARSLGANSFPQMFLQTPEDEYYQLAQGFSTLRDIESRLRGIDTK